MFLACARQQLVSSLLSPAWSGVIPLTDRKISHFHHFPLFWIIPLTGSIKWEHIYFYGCGHVFFPKSKKMEFLQRTQDIFCKLFSFSVWLRLSHILLYSSHPLSSGSFSLQPDHLSLSLSLSFLSSMPLSVYSAFLSTFFFPSPIFFPSL